MGFYDPKDWLSGIPRPNTDRRLVYENEIMFMTIDLAAGYRAEPHRHTWPTLYYVTAGSGRALVGEEWRDVGPGTLVMVPAESMHAIEAVTNVSIVEVQANCPQQFVNGVLGR